MLLPAQPLLPIFSAYVGTLALNCTCSYLQKVFILQYFLCNRKIPKNWCEANTAFSGIFLGHKFIFCNSVERPQAVCYHSLAVLKIRHSRQKILPRSFNFCQNNDNIEMWHFLCYCLHSHLKCDNSFGVKTIAV